MKKVIVLFLFFFSLGYSEEQLGGVLFYYPLNGDVIQSGSWDPGHAHIIYYYSVNLVSVQSWGSTLQKYNSSTGQYVTVSTNYGNSGFFDVISIGSYKVIGAAVGTNLAGQHVSVSGYVDITVQDNVAPNTPAGYSISLFNTGDNAYPKITWTQNNEWDVIQNTQDGYIVERKVNDGSFSQLTTVSGNTTTYIDYNIYYANLNYGIYSASYRIRSKDVNGNLSSYTDIKTTRWGDAWKLKPMEATIVSEYKLHQNYPNPFNPNTTVQYDVKEPGMVKLEVYDILGNKIRDMVNEVKETGTYSVVFDASNLTSGIYLCKLSVNNFTSTNKMILLK